MAFSISIICAYYLRCFLIHNNLRFYSVALFLSQVVMFLLFFGLASMRRAERPGSI